MIHFIKLFIIILLIVPNYVFGDNMFNNGGIFNKGSSGGGSGTVSSGTIGQDAVYTGATTIGSGLLTETASNVGIGSTAPGQKLDVQGTLRGTAFIKSGGTSSQFLKADGSVDSTSYGAGTVTNVTGTSPLTSSGGATPAISINSSTGTGAVVLQTSPNLTANVGIGSASPGQALDVQGTVRMTGLTLNLNPNAGYVMVGSSVGVGTWMAASTLPTSGGSGTVTSSTINQVARFNTTGTTVQGSTILFDDSTNVGIGTVGPTALLDVNRKFIVLSGGNVGIGTVGPTGLLSIGSTGQFTITSGGGATTASSSPYTFTGANPVLNASGGTAGSTLELKCSGSSTGGCTISTGTGSSGTSDFTNFKFKNDTITGMTILDSSSVVNVGIGTVAPRQKLDVQGTLILTGIGHISSHGTAPTVANNACGSTVQGSVAANSTDVAGTVVVGTVAVTSCAVTFASQWQTVPVCVANDDTNVLAIRPSETTSGITFTSLSSASGDSISWICFGAE